MAYAEYMAGLGFSNGRLGCVHAMAHPVGSAYGVAHGVCCAVLLPFVCEYNLIAVPERFAEIAAALGEKTCGLSVIEAAAKAPAAIRKLNQDIGMPANIAELGAKEADLEKLAKESITEIPVRTNPRTVSYEQMLGIYKAAMGEPMASSDTLISGCNRGWRL